MTMVAFFSSIKYKVVSLVSWLKGMASEKLWDGWNLIKRSNRETREK
jgi:hypothetical protein